jgi:hypothetical protein
MASAEKSFAKFFRRYWLSLLLALLCAVLLWSAVAGAIQLYRSGNFHRMPRHSRTRPASLPLADIQPWMTFDYLNHVFNLPPEYLRQSLNISDPAYPRLQIGHYTREKKIDTTVFLNAVRQAIRNRPPT